MDRLTRHPLALLVGTGLAFDVFALVVPAVRPGWGAVPLGASAPYSWNWVVLLLFVPYAGGLWGLSRRRGAAPRPETALALAALVAVPLVIAPAWQSHDVYQYLFYARMQIVHGANPYVVSPARFAGDPWFGYASWAGRPSVYGPLWTLPVAGIVAAAGVRLVASVIAVKAFAAALTLAAGWGLAATVGPDADLAPSAVALAFVLNPLVLSSEMLGGHPDAALAAAFAWAAAWDRRGRRFAAGAALAAAVLVKAYAVLPLLVYLFVLWRRGERRVAAGVLGFAVVLAAACYAPYWAGRATFATLLGAVGLSSSSLAATVQGWLSDALRLAGVGGHAAIAADVVRAAGAAVLVVVAWLLARSPRTAEDPWRAAALLLGTFFLVTPWYLPWYAVGLLALALATCDRPVRAATLVFSASSLAQAPGAAGLVRTVLRYAPPPAAAWLAARRAAGGRTAAAPGTSRIRAPSPGPLPRS